MQKSIRKTHEFLNSSKHQSRLNNINIVKQSNLIRDNKLICSWCELMGASGMETLSLLEDEGLMTNNFIGIDTDFNLINNYKQQRPDLQWFSENIFDIIPKLNNIGVLNLDIYGNINNKRDYFNLGLIKNLIIKSVERFGEFILFYNKDLDGVVREKKNIGISLRQHTNKICEIFNGYLPNRILNSLSILPEKSEQEIDNGFIGQIGAYEIYKGKSKGHRMANLHLIFR
jgi:hypothetical protein